MCTGDHSRYGLATNFSVCVIKLYTTFFLQVMLTCEIAEGSILTNVDIFGRELRL